MAMPLVQHHIESMILYRSDNRDLGEIGNAGGFVPRYLLEYHPGGFDGFRDCKNKTPGNMGCNCSGMGPSELFERARSKFEYLLRNPGEVQAHVIFNRDGYLSTSFKAKEDEETVSATHRYLITVSFRIQGDAEVVRNMLGKTGLPVPPLYKRIEFFLTPVLKMIAVKPLGKVELTFLTPIPLMCLSKVR